ncbi:MAG: electron transport complex subunit RsxA [Firmicutes bacterium]|jgi:electron transport complex protein RnfA|nr:electron transport complex subunit RsxA [Bacillota bacterium]
MTSLALIFVGAVLVNNFVLVRFLGICPFLGVSKQLDTALGMGMATTFVMVLSGAATWLVENYILIPYGLPFLQTLSYILIIASLVQVVEMFLQKTSPGLYRALGIFLPLITTNCAVLGLALMATQQSYSLVETIVFALGTGGGFTLALAAMAGIREQMEFADIPKALQGAGISLITAGLMSLAFMGFSGLISM